MDYCNCKKCNKIFNHFSGPILCKECDKEVFYLIKNYIENNKFANASIISKELNIPIKIVNDYIRDDRIVEIRKDINLYYYNYIFLYIKILPLLYYSYFLLYHQLDYTILLVY